VAMDSGRREGKRGTTNGGDDFLYHGGGSSATAWLSFMVSGMGAGRGTMCNKKKIIIKK
jgi:hypothetical protein